MDVWNHPVMVISELVPPSSTSIFAESLVSCVNSCISDPTCSAIQFVNQNGNGEFGTIASPTGSPEFTETPFGGNNCEIFFASDMDSISAFIEDPFGGIFAAKSSFTEMITELMGVSPDPPTLPEDDVPESTVTCTSMSTDYGIVKYIETTPTKYSTANFKNEIFHQSGDCADNCLHTAGCYSFTDDGADCINIIGAFRDEGEDQSVIDSGKLTSQCDNSAVLAQSFSKVSEFKCQFQTAAETDDVIAQLLADNGLQASVPLDSWIPQNLGGGQSKSQFVHLSSGTLDGEETDGPSWRWIKFTIKTFTRDAVNGRRRRRRQTVESIDEDIIDAIVQNGNLNNNIGDVLSTTPPETVSFSQLSSSGDPAADCSSGVCVCNDGFIDIGDGNGCQASVSSSCMVGSSRSFDGLTQITCKEGDICMYKMIKRRNGLTGSVRREYVGTCNTHHACVDNYRADNCQYFKYGHRGFMATCFSCCTGLDCHNYNPSEIEPNTDFTNDVVQG